ncbi:MAG TPA: redoxin domain-containing protein [Verrucomicrobiota bacterium]|nr:redoxin domain-containing protein [Verrucomicrobiota bacterium]
MSKNRSVDEEVSCCCCGPVTVGGCVPCFEMDAWSPAEAAFTKVSSRKLKEAGEWTVLFFYPAAYTPVCPTELEELAENHAVLQKLGAEVVSVSTDTKFVQSAWQQSEKLLEGVKFTMAADPTGKVSKMFGVYDEETGLALRGTFIISPAGKLVSSEVSYYNVARSAKELVRKVEANVYVGAHPDQVCPARWKAAK